MDGALVDAWQFFPGFKVGQIHFCLSFLTIIEWRLLEVVAEYGVRLFLGHAVGQNCFILLFLFFLVRVHSSRVEALQIRRVFVPRYFICG